jgi:hypothetical protein
MRSLRCEATHNRCPIEAGSRFVVNIASGALSFGVTRLIGDAFGSVPLLAATLSAIPSVENSAA